MSLYEPGRELDKWIAENVEKVEWQPLYMPTLYADLAIRLLEDFLRNHKEYTHVEMAFDAKSDTGWIVLIRPVDEKAFMPMSSSYGHGLAFTICRTLYRAVANEMGLI